MNLKTNFEKHINDCNNIIDKIDNYMDYIQNTSPNEVEFYNNIRRNHADLQNTISSTDIYINEMKTILLNMLDYFNFIIRNNITDVISKYYSCRLILSALISLLESDRLEFQKNGIDA